MDTIFLSDEYFLVRMVIFALNQYVKAMNNQSFKKGLLSFVLLFLLTSVFAQLDLNPFKQRLRNDFLFNSAITGKYRSKTFGYAHQVTSGSHNAAVWGQMAFGKYLHADIKDQEKGYSGIGLVLNTTSFLGTNYNNAHFTYAYHSVFGKKGSYKKTVVSLAATGTFINSPDELNSSLGASFAFSRRKLGAGISFLNLNEPESELINGFGSLPMKTNFFVEALGGKWFKGFYVYPALYGTYTEAEELKLNLQATVSIMRRVRFYTGVGPNNGAMIGFGSYIKKVSFAYYLNSDAIGVTHEWGLQYGVSRSKKENKQWY